MNELSLVASMSARKVDTVNYIKTDVGTAWRLYLIVFAITAVGLPKLLITLEWWQWNLVLLIISVVGAVIAIVADTRSERPCIRGFILPFSLYSVIFLFFEIEYSSLMTGYRATTLFTTLSLYGVSVLVIPICYMMRRGYISLDGLLKTVAVIVSFSLLVRVFLSTVETATGTALCPGISLEQAATGWTRNGIVRINPPSLAVLLIGICLYFLCYRNKGNKVFLAILILYLLFTFFVHSSRSVLGYSFICIAILFLVKRHKSKAMFLLVALMGALACFSVFYEPVGGFFVSYFGSLFDMSASNIEAGSTLVRISGLNYFGNLYLSTNPLLGFGAWSYGDQVVMSGGLTLDDLGFLGVVFKFGVPGILLYALILGRILYACVKARRHGGEVFEGYSTLLLGFLLMIVFNLINIDLFYMYAASVPLALAISEAVLDSVCEVSCV